MRNTSLPILYYYELLIKMSDNDEHFITQSTFTQESFSDTNVISIKHGGRLS